MTNSSHVPFLLRNVKLTVCSSRGLKTNIERANPSSTSLRHYDLLQVFRDLIHY